MGVSVHVEIMANLVFRRAYCYGNSALVPKDAGMSFDLVEMVGALRLLDVVYDGF
jgi:hypothetical protein